MRPTRQVSLPLMIAGEENHVELAEFFIAKGADVNHAEIHGYMPITRAFWKGNNDIIKLYRTPWRDLPRRRYPRQRAEVTRCTDIHD